MLSMANKISMGLRLSPEAVNLIKELAGNLGVSQADIVEMSVRLFKQHRSIIDPTNKSEGDKNDVWNLRDNQHDQR